MAVAVKNKEEIENQDLALKEIKNFLSVAELHPKRLDISSLSKVEYYAKEPISGRESILKNSLTKFGFKSPVIVNQRQDGSVVVIDGYQRMLIWEKLGNTSVPVILFNEPLQRERELHVYLNRMAFDFDIDSLLYFIDDLKPEDFGLSGLDEENFDDREYHNKLSKKILENRDKSIQRLRLSYKTSEVDEIKHKLERIGKQNNLKNNSEIVKWLIDNYNG